MSETGRRHLKQGQLAMGKALLQVLTGDDVVAAEALARGALSDFAAAMNWLEDTPEFEVAHFRLDEAGRWIRETLGCWLTRDGTKYTRTCPADFAHIRVGMSPGMRNVIRECTVCGQDPRLCRHIKGRTYASTRRIVGGHCNLCGQEACDHEDGETGEVLSTHWIVSADLDEVSLVPRPAQPMARIQSLSVPLDDLKAALGPRGWVPGMEVSCDKCLVACGGVREYDPTRGPMENLSRPSQITLGSQ